MVAATKKRGRPISDRYAYGYELRNVNNEEKSDRTVRNRLNAEAFICLLMDRKEWDIEDFFSTSEGLLRHNGIAEQIGRLLEEDIITDDQAVEIALSCINDYNSGKTSKTIENELRQYRINRKRG